MKGVEILNDEEIIELYLARDESAIKETSFKYGDRLRKLSYSITEDNFTAEECENDTYIQAWNSIPPNEPREHFYAFLARITRNLSLNAIRDRNRIKRSAKLTDITNEIQYCLPISEDADVSLDEKLLVDSIGKYLKSVSKEKRIMFIRRYWYLDSVTDISKKMGISESKVKTTLFRLRKELKKFLEKEGWSI